MGSLGHFGIPPKEVDQQRSQNIDTNDIIDDEKFSK